MNQISRVLFVALLTCGLFAQAQPGSARFPVEVLVQSPAETQTDLQVICLFESSPVNTLHGSLLEMNERLKGLLDRVRKP